MLNFFLGVLATVAFALYPWSRGHGIDVRCVGQTACPRIKGISDILDRNKRVNLLIVHGMGADATTDYTPFTQTLARKLGLHLAKANDESIPGNPPGTAPARLFERTYVSDTRSQLRVYELHWWPLIQNSKSRLIADERYYPGHRARFNRSLKSNLVNNRIADPIIYLGPLGSPIKDSVRYTLRRIGTDMSPDEPITTPTVIVTESLGSEIAFAVLSEAQAGDYTREITAAAPEVFMLANQIPLLRLAREHPERSEPSPFTVNEPGNARNGRRQIVAVSDPSDLLSYPIPESISEDGTLFINVVRPLGHRLLGNNAVEPLGAHTGAKSDPLVVDMIACGRPARCGALVGQPTPQTPE
jgi:hypothetical protein